MSIAERKEREKEQRRQDILRAAKTIFFQNGFEKTSMEMIAEECQLAKGTLYLYFKSKEELYLSLVEDGIRILDEMMSQTLALRLQPDQKLLAIVRTYFRFAQTYREHFTIFKMIDVGTLSGKVEQEKLDEIQRLRMSAFERMERVAAKAIEQGAFKTTHKPRELILMLWAATAGAMMMCADKCQQLDMFKEVDSEKFVMRIASALIESFKTANVPEKPLGREPEPQNARETEPQTPITADAPSQ